MLCLEELIARDTRETWAPRWARRQEKFISKVFKLCPKCGAILSLKAKGCDNCLYQFKKEE